MFVGRPVAVVLGVWSVLPEIKESENNVIVSDMNSYQSRHSRHLDQVPWQPASSSCSHPNSSAFRQY